MCSKPSRKNELQKKRAGQLMKIGCLLLLCGVSYYIFISVTGLAIPCPFHALTGLKCPGCGVTTMFMALVEGNICKALRANIVLFASSPVIIYLVLHSAYRYIRFGYNGESKADSIIVAALIIIFILWGILRNFLSV